MISIIGVDHPALSPPGDHRRWFPCQQPERPPDDATCWHVSVWSDSRPCRGCLVAARARYAREPTRNHGITLYLVSGVHPEDPPAL